MPYLSKSVIAGITLAPRSTDPTKTSLYLVDRATDNNVDPSENDGKMYEVAIDSALPPPPGTFIDVSVSAASDDAEESPSTRVQPANSDLEMVMDGTVQQAVGVRFAGVAVPAAATITAAYIQFVADESQSEDTSLMIQAQASGDALTFSADRRGDVTLRPRTSAQASWFVAPWTANGAGLAQRTPDLSALVQEVVNRGDWIGGNAMAFVITGTGHRTAEPFEEPTVKMPRLHIEYG